jgi:acyl-CoA synthetase (AMP-forming)/AMP-acid ligase II
MSPPWTPIEAAPVLARISDYPTWWAERTPTSEALVLGDRRLTWREFEAQVARCAKALIAAGVSKGDRVAMLSTPGPDFMVVFLATARIGGVWLGLSPRYKLDEYRYLLGDAAPRVVFAIPSFEGRDYRADFETLQSEAPSLETLVFTDALEAFLSGGEVVSDRVLADRAAAVEPMDPALIVYTSGSSGKPKGAVLSHRGLCFGNAVQGREFGVHLPRAVCPFPINHVACVGDTCCTTMIRGGTVVFLERFDPVRVLETIETESINLWIGVPTMFILAAATPGFEARDLSSLRTLVWGGAPMPREHIERFQSLGARLLTLYGLTESTTDISFTPPWADIDDLAATVGRPPAEFPCRVARPDGEVCDPNEAGEIQVRGDFVMLGYFNRPEATRDAFTADGWLKSGDVGYFRPDGALVFTGRLSEMFKSGGFNVYPREIEDVLAQHPAVALVAVIGVSDPLYGEVGEAYVQLAQGADADDLAAFCKARLADYKVPKRFFLRDVLPVLPVGKIDKPLLKREAAARG